MRKALGCLAAKAVKRNEHASLVEAGHREEQWKAFFEQQQPLIKQHHALGHLHSSHLTNTARSTDMH